MKTLIQGCESAEQFEVLLQLTGISSEDKKNALRAHLVEGLPAKRAYARFHVTQQHFSQALMLLNKKADLAMQYASLQKSKGEQNFDELRQRIIEAKQAGGYPPLLTDGHRNPPGDD
ncbi:adhesin biosynthesis transcription regulatory family protein [Shewanella sp. SW36]|uniref:adhesin biosynthesis transcription regulatory family protein n=1 Tax=unclassified Shewanella TaxID=196818 RepID=UPI0021DACA1E|nr:MULTISPECIES: adhesin biosynthesis transcription regulatory family protein [unclassified Shewanella]MCU7977579.1 adhesin biosynthesis transcription regulatory family protein [Shewanella sp. SW36]MCU7992837.1 adhesin biosynthesis transcription regulatory family protein [Shewanella sp. SW1]MCU8054082.1 adhesin biosynthesis transcription regulatory family protein [Shewanella sp. SM43]